MKQPKRIGPKEKHPRGEEPIEALNLHDTLLDAAKNGLIYARETAIEQGLPAVGLYGYVFDLEDPLVPAPIRTCQAAQDAIRQAKGKHAAIQVSVDERSKLIGLLTPLAYKLAGMEIPMIISVQHDDPPLLMALRAQHDPNLLPVIVIAGRQLSVKGLPVNSIIQPKGRTLA